ncbi:MAG: LPS export ABC transporter ATP-binding protein [Candidatus Riflebacteria bacterium]|nr:LPS export ABC transporter ATP-binding protein [Candidatus Riflebacteria bacterium]
MLTTRGVCKTYKGRKVVDSVSIEVEPGKVIGLLGPNGAGKTTTFYMVVGLVRPDVGDIGLDGTDITWQPMHRRARMGIGYLAQEPSVFRLLTVEQNMQAVLEFLEPDRRKRQARIEEILAELSITGVRKSPGYSLSGGERRRVEIARALCTRPRYLLLDEPFAGVDPIAVGDIQRIIAYLRQKGLGILITDHNVRETLSIVDRAYIMNEGRIMVSGGVAEVLNNPDARRIYLGERFTLGGEIRPGDVEALSPGGKSGPGQGVV